MNSDEEQIRLEQYFVNSSIKTPAGGAKLVNFAISGKEDGKAFCSCARMHLPYVMVQLS